jgi:hydrogenase maturation protease
MTLTPRNPSIETCERTRPIVVIGIGSPHGDDRAGWEVVDRLSIARNEPEALAEPHRKQSASASGSDSKVVVLHKASVPHDILDWFDVQSPTHIIDASCDPLSEVRCFAITQSISGRLKLNKVDSIETASTSLSSESLRSSSTHQLDLISTLELSATLGTLPRELFLWTVSVTSVVKNGKISHETQMRIDRCVAAIAKEICHA